MKNNFKICLAVSLLLVSASSSKAQPWLQAGNNPVTGTNNIIGSIDPVNNVPIRLFVNNSEKMRTWGNGNIGIGTTTSFTLDKLHVTGNNTGNNTRVDIENVAGSNYGSYLMLDNANNTAGDTWFVGSTGTGNAPGKAGFFEVWQQSKLHSRMVIDDNGNLGIDDSIPAERVHIVGEDANRNTQIRLENGFNSNFGSYLELDNADNAGGDKWFVGSSGSFNAPSAPGFYEVFQGSTKLSRMVIDPNGQTGIGTVAPTAKLHVECGHPINATNIRFEDLQTYVGPPIPVLLIDDQGYVWKSKSFMANKHSGSSGSNNELESRVHELETEIKALTAQLNAFTGTLNTENTKINAADVLQVSPNPTNGNLNITYNLPQLSDNASMIITDMTGKKIMEKAITSSNGQMSITLPDSVASGIILCSVINGNNSVTTRQIVLNKK